MNGYCYSNCILPEFQNTKILEQRGNSSFTKTITNLGEFGYTSNFESNPNGCLLYDGNIENVSDDLDENLSKTVDAIRSLTSQYSLIYVTDSHIVFCTDQFSTKQLWYYYSPSNKKFFASTSRSVVIEHCPGAWLAEENKIYIIDKHDFSINILKNTVWNFEQNISNYDKVFQAFENAIDKRHLAYKTTYTLSAGFDTGAICSAANKMFMRDQMKILAKVGLEDKELLGARAKIHRASVIKDVDPGAKNIAAQIYEDLPYVMINSATADSIITFVQNHVLKEKNTILIFGIGGDQLYSDYMHPEEPGKFTKNSMWPEALETVFPYHNYGNANVLRQVLRADAICAWFGVNAQMPLLDRTLYQAWLNTTNKLKNTSYKDWMRCYMKELDYPFNERKTGMST